VEQGDSGASVRVVLDAGYAGRNIDFVPLEIDETIPSLVAPAAMAGGDTAMGIPAAFLGKAADKGLLGLGGREFPEGGIRLMSSSCRGRFEFL
jgi:hypothetical protein